MTKTTQRFVLLAAVLVCANGFAQDPSPQADRINSTDDGMAFVDSTRMLISNGKGSTTLSMNGTKDKSNGVLHLVQHLTSGNVETWTGPNLGPSSTKWTFRLQPDSTMCFFDDDYKKSSPTYIFDPNDGSSPGTTAALVVNDDGTMGLYPVTGNGLSKYPIWLSSRPKGFGTNPKK